MKFWKKTLAALAVLLVFGGIGVPALAALPERPADSCVLDSAGVLSEATEREINRKNESLFNATGAEIAIAAVDFLGGEEIDDYAYSLFNYWGVGSQERNNGLLLVLAIGEDDYYAVPGYGIDDLFSGGELQTLLDDYLEDDFAVGDYDAGVKKFFDAAYEELVSYDYDDAYSAQDYNPGGTYEDYSSYYTDYDDGRSGFSTLVGLIVFIVVMFLVFRLLSALLRSLAQGGAGRSYYNRGTPYYQNYTGSGGFWRGLFLGNLLSRRRSGWYRPYGQVPPPPGNGWGQTRPPRSGPTRPGSGGFSSFGGFGGSSHTGGSRPSGGGFSRGGGASRSSGGFSRGGGSRGGGAGRR